MKNEKIVVLLKLLFQQQKRIGVPDTRGRSPLYRAPLLETEASVYEKMNRKKLVCMIWDSLHTVEPAFTEFTCKKYYGDLYTAIQCTNGVYQTIAIEFIYSGRELRVNFGIEAAWSLPFFPPPARFCLSDLIQERQNYDFAELRDAGEASALALQIANDLRQQVFPFFREGLENPLLAVLEMEKRVRARRNPTQSAGVDRPWDPMDRSCNPSAFYFYPLTVLMKDYSAMTRLLSDEIKYLNKRAEIYKKAAVIEGDSTGKYKEIYEKAECDANVYQIQFDHAAAEDDAFFDSLTHTEI